MDARAPSDRASPWRSLLPAAFATGVAAVLLVGLGVWQLERLHWKEELIARIAARGSDNPQPLPPEASWPALKSDDYDYRRVQASGQTIGMDTVLVFRGAGPNAPSGEGPGYLVMTPLRLPDGSAVIVNRGFVPLAHADEVLRQSRDSDISVVGLMRPSEPRNSFTPADEPAKGHWYTRDPAAIAAHFGLARAAPFSIDAVTVSDPAASSGGSRWPRPGATEMNIPNNHLSYAFTWFGLALGLLGVFTAFALKRLRPGKS